MRARERPAADLPVEARPLAAIVVEVDRALPVPQLAAVEVALLPVDSGRPVPAEEDVADRLHQPLTSDDPLAVIA